MYVPIPYTASASIVAILATARKDYDTSEFGEEWSALHYACYQGHMEVAAILLASVAGGPKQSALVNITNKMGFAPLFYAAQRQHLQLVKLLLESLLKI